MQQVGWPRARHPSLLSSGRNIGRSPSLAAPRTPCPGNGQCSESRSLTRHCRISPLRHRRRCKRRTEKRPQVARIRPSGSRGEGRGVAVLVLRAQHRMTADGNAGIFASSTETPPRSRRRIFTYRKMKIATSPFVYRGAHVFMPEKLGNLQGQGTITTNPWLKSVVLAGRTTSPPWRPDNSLPLLARIALPECSFPNASHLKNVFKRETGMSMREWRETH